MYNLAVPMRQKEEQGNPIRALSVPGIVRALSLLLSSGVELRELGKALLMWKYDLTRGQIETLDLLARGLTNDQIVRALDLADAGTVKNRLGTIFEKMRVRSRTKAAAIAARYGLGEDAYRSR